MISRVRSGCSNISTLRDCDVQSVTQRGVASSGRPRPVGSLSTVVWSVRASTTSISATLFEKKHLRPSQVVLLLRGVAKGESSLRLAQELGGVSRSTVHELRKESYRRTPEGFN